MMQMRDACQTDDRFVAEFMAGSLAPERFDHRAHLRAAWCLLRRLPFLEACIAMRDGLRLIAARAGKPGLYHETITVASMSLVLDRMVATGDRPADEADGAADRLAGATASATDPGPVAASIVVGTAAAETADPLDFDTLLARCPELLDRGLLRRYYRAEELADATSRQRFVLPRPAAAANGRSATSDTR